MVNKKNLQKLRALRIGAGVSFILALILSTFLASLSIINVTKLESYMAEQFHTGVWYSYPEIVASIIAGFSICLLFLHRLYENLKLHRVSMAFEDMAKTDVLTGIHNRRYLEDSLDKIIKSVSRSNNYLSILMLDVDFFKKYNDTYGHSVGDSCLRMIAEVLRQSVSREEDFVARYGGEEFAVVLPFTDEKGAEIVAIRMLENIRSQKMPHESSDIEKFITVSIGGTSGIVKHTHSGTDYIKHADKALYLSKQNGRNRYTYLGFEP